MGRGRRRRDRRAARRGRAGTTRRRRAGASRCCPRTWGSRPTPWGSTAAQPRTTAVVRMVCSRMPSPCRRRSGRRRPTRRPVPRNAARLVGSAGGAGAAGRDRGPEPDCHTAVRPTVEDEPWEGRMDVGRVTLASNVFAALNVANAWRAFDRRSIASIPVFLAGWPTSELPMPMLGAHLAGNVLAARRGEFRGRTGLASWRPRSRRRRRVCGVAAQRAGVGSRLRGRAGAALGAGYRDRIAHPRFPGPGAAIARTPGPVRMARIRRRFARDSNVCTGRRAGRTCSTSGGATTCRPTRGRRCSCRCPVAPGPSATSRARPTR